MMQKPCSSQDNSQPASDERTRFARHLKLPEVGVAGQARLRESAVLVVGAGGLGSSALIHLAASGVGRIGIVDPDKVALDNLHRQILYGMPDVGMPKTERAARRLAEVNPQITFDLFPVSFSESNADSLARPYLLIVDGTDNFTARTLINRICVRQRKPMIFGSAQRFEGQVCVFDSRKGSCFRCVFPDLSDSAMPEPPAETGVFGPMPGIVGALQALEAMKLLLHVGSPLSDRLLTINGLSGKFSAIRIGRRPDCPDCGDFPGTSRYQGNS
jgi:molybdopterin/thiamine biosynthesis adenylyltransferase